MLSHRQLCDLVDRGVIQGLLSKDQINGTSIDVRLGENILVEGEGRLVDFRERQSLNLIEKTISDFTPLYLFPKQFVLGHTMETFNLPRNLTAIFTMKSSAGRIGLNHALAAFCDPGWNNSKLTLELTNDTSLHTLVLRPGDFIGQMYFFEHDEVPWELSYAKRGRYNNDLSVSGIKV